MSLPRRRVWSNSPLDVDGQVPMAAGDISLDQLHPHEVPLSFIKNITAPREGREDQYPPASIMASAVRVTSKSVSSAAFRRTTYETWQDDAWAMFDLVGELRFLTTTLAQRTKKGRLYVGKLSDDPSQDPVEVQNDSPLTDLLNAIGKGHLGMGEIIERMTQNLFITGDGWLIGIPNEKLDGSSDMLIDDSVQAVSLAPKTQVNRVPGLVAPDNPTTGQPVAVSPLENMTWRCLSISEVSFQQGGEVKIYLGPTPSEQIVGSPDELFMIRVWRSHPRIWWQSDSPVRSSLPTLRELVGLTMHISAQVDSRLAGAGMLIVPESASRAMKAAANLPPDSAQDPFIDALMQAMLTPIGDRSNASALVPLVVTVPDDVAGDFHHITFDKPLDVEAKALREEGIRRLALGLDAPPELLLGTNAMNHWGAWLMQEEVVQAHIVPPLQLFCNALTTQYLRPMMLENGYSEEECEQYCIWYNVDDLIIRPNKAEDAQALFDKGVLNAKALRRENGFDEDDAPADETDDPAVAAVFEMVKADPGLMLRPGLDVILKQVKALLDGRPLPAIDGSDEKKASQAVAGPNVQDVEGASVEPIMPPTGAPAIGAPAAARPVNPAPTNPAQQKVHPVGAPTIGRPAKTRPAGLQAAAVERPVALRSLLSPAQLGVHGSLSRQLGDTTVVMADDDILDLTGAK